MHLLSIYLFPLCIFLSSFYLPFISPCCLSLPISPPLYFIFLPDLPVLSRFTYLLFISFHYFPLYYFVTVTFVFTLPFSLLILPFITLLLTHSCSPSVLLSVPPLIQPFDFPPTSIGKLMYIACVVSSGDMPIRITWRKDGQEIVPSSGITIDTKEFMSSLQISKVSLKHNGNYTCIASNDAATVSTERQLTVTGKKKTQ